VRGTGFLGTAALLVDQRRRARCALVGVGVAPLGSSIFNCSGY
jgi:hypothetical protein